ncbi:hypothetical protein BDW60DRAFT_206156 [Aspergillus nidulans var. acristatus]
MQERLQCETGQVDSAREWLAVNSNSTEQTQSPLGRCRPVQLMHANPAANVTCCRHRSRPSAGSRGAPPILLAALASSRAGLLATSPSLRASPAWTPTLPLGQSCSVPVYGGDTPEDMQCTMHGPNGAHCLVSLPSLPLVSARQRQRALAAVSDPVNGVRGAGAGA